MTISLYSTLIVIVLRGYGAAFLSHCWFLFILWYGAVDIQIWALLTWSQCKISDTQVTVKACGPLVSKCVKTHFEKLRTLKKNSKRVKWDQVNELWKRKFFQSAIISAILTNFEKKFKNSFCMARLNFLFKHIKDNNKLYKWIISSIVLSTILSIVHSFVRLLK